MGRMERGGSEAFIGAERGAQGGGISLIPEGEVRRLRRARTVLRAYPSGRLGTMDRAGPHGSATGKR